MSAKDSPTEQAHYLHPDFDPWSITKDAIREILVQHHVRPPLGGSVRKQQLVDLFNKHIRPELSLQAKDNDTSSSSSSSDDEDTKQKAAVSKPTATKKKPAAKTAPRQKRVSKDDEDEKPTTKAASRKQTQDPEETTVEKPKRSQSKAAAAKTKSESEAPARGRPALKKQSTSEDESDIKHGRGKDSNAEKPAARGRGRSKSREPASAKPAARGTGSRSRSRSRQPRQSAKERDLGRIQQQNQQQQHQPAFSKFMQSFQPTAESLLPGQSMLLQPASAALAVSHSVTSGSSAEVPQRYGRPRRNSNTSDAASAAEVEGSGSFLPTSVRHILGLRSLVLAVIVLAVGVWYGQKVMETMSSSSSAPSV
ncbi:inner nuclear membrane protein enriched at telomere/subtelomere region [Lunasporangiospora selenospora]|uniref:Inner nuclear membrane protein enriched at telomere/subtelomere region n=1 Tax=Lunasporangiospora selenospora TaxID=979761 RepID=A0A9P6FKI8_9FUNG|nr:inner nuclear membrane protein enriched at telomere/subtelomere region [Lunasporangiospora selenospora]